jgi:uncharacterized protein YjbJ (UPF0337 family)
MSSDVQAHELLMCVALAHAALAHARRSKSARKGNEMNRDQIKGVAQQIKGKLNEVVGRATGNRTQQIKGDLQQAARTARKALGDGKQKLRRTGR